MFLFGPLYLILIIVSSKRLKILIEQIILQELKTDEPKGGPLGKVAFAPQRTDDVEPEPNTPEEDILFTSIDRHIVFHDSSMLSNYFEEIYKLSNSGKYKNIFTPPSGLAYRLLYNLNKSDIKNLFKISDKDLKSDDNVGKSEINNILNPINEHGLQSWMTNPNLEGFIDLVDSGEHGSYVAIVKTKIPSGGKFILNPEISRKIKNFSAFADEYEVVSKGPVKIEGGVYCNVFIDPDITEASVKNRLREMLSVLRTV